MRSGQQTDLARDVRPVTAKRGGSAPKTRTRSAWETSTGWPLVSMNCFTNPKGASVRSARLRGGSSSDWRLTTITVLNRLVSEGRLEASYVALVTSYLELPETIPPSS